MNPADRSVRYRPLEERDIPGLVARYNEWFEPLSPLYSHPLDPEVFARKVLAHPDYDPRGSILAESDGRMVGYALTGARTHSVNENDPLAGASLCLIMVHPDRRRRGIGRSLVERSAAFAQSRGRDVLTNHANPASPFSFFNGIQEEWTGARALFEATGFRLADTSCTCRQSLGNLAPNPYARERRSALEAQGFLVSPCGAALAGPLLEAAAYHYFYWYVDCRSKVDPGAFPFLETAFMSLRPADIYGPEDVIVLTRGGRVFSYVVMARNRGGGTAFLGPMWTDPQIQRQGAGSVVLQEALRRERDIHGTAIVDLWCSESNASGFYARNGFSVAGRWLEYERRLA